MYVPKSMLLNFLKSGAQICDASLDEPKPSDPFTLYTVYEESATGRNMYEHRGIVHPEMFKALLFADLIKELPRNKSHNKTQVFFKIASRDDALLNAALEGLDVLNDVSSWIPVTMALPPLPKPIEELPCYYARGYNVLVRAKNPSYLNYEVARWRYEKMEPRAKSKPPYMRWVNEYGQVRDIGEVVAWAPIPDADTLAKRLIELGCMPE